MTVAGQTIGTRLPDVDDNTEGDAIDGNDAPSHPDLWTAEEMAAKVEYLGDAAIERLRAILGPKEQYAPAIGERPNPFLEEDGTL